MHDTCQLKTARSGGRPINCMRAQQGISDLRMSLSKMHSFTWYFVRLALGVSVHSSISGTAKDVCCTVYTKVRIWECRLSLMGMLTVLHTFLCVEMGDICRIRSLVIQMNCILSFLSLNYQLVQGHVKVAISQRPPFEYFRLLNLVWWHMTFVENQCCLVGHCCSVVTCGVGSNKPKEWHGQFLFTSVYLQH